VIAAASDMRRANAHQAVIARLEPASSDGVDPCTDDYFGVKIFTKSIGPLSFVHNAIYANNLARVIAYPENQYTAVGIRKRGKRLAIIG
jgi:hypothetical protein